MNISKFLTAAFLLLFLAGACSSQAGTIRTWVPTSGTNDWFDRNNWNPNDDYPKAGDDVTVATAGAVLLTNSTEYLGSLTLSKTLIFSNWNTTLSATNVIISGTMTHYAQTATATNASGVWVPDNRVYIVCLNLTVASAGKIDANAKGYKSGGYGPGAATGRGGGGYGGVGGSSGGGSTYGSASAPTDPGSSSGSAGGGVVRIEAGGAVTNNGTITANGEGNNNRTAGGSGGSVYITCATFSGSGGLISADGGIGIGDLNWAGIGGGGGGRVAIIYNAAAQALLPIPDVIFSASGSLGGYPGGYACCGDIGTLYFTDNRFLTESIRHRGQWMGQPLLTNWAPNNLVVSNGWLKFPTERFQLNVTNNVTVMGSDSYIHRLELTNGIFTCGGDFSLNSASLMLYAGATSGPTFTCGGNLVMTNNAKLVVYIGPTNGVGPNYGALVDVTGSVTILNAWIYPYSNPTLGGSVLFRMRNLMISGGINAGFDANYKGYKRGGYGPGAATGYGGGGYGGVGGSSVGGTTYGSASAPIDPGSSGGPSWSSGGAGGGVVRIQAGGTVTNNGTMTANGEGNRNRAAGGAGGSVYITCATFSGSGGLISADGGPGVNDPPTGGSDGGGGGGRIAVIYTDTAAQNLLPIPDVIFSASGNPGLYPGGYANCGDIGTLYFTDNRFLTENIRHRGQWMGQPLMTTWGATNLTVSNGWIRFPTDGFQLTVTNDVTVIGNNPYIHRLELTSKIFTCGRNIDLNSASLVLYRGAISGPTLTCSGNLVMTNNAKFKVYSGPTNGIAPDYGALVTVAGSVTISNAWIYPFSHPTNGGSVLFRMRNLTIYSINGGFDASTAGFQAGYGPGAGQAPYGGGGYGGKGGDTGGGQTYGSSNAPLAAGSGGRLDNGASGGGSVRIQVNGIFLYNGSILANGAARATERGSGGSGGGVYITCKTFSGTSGVIYANGGNGSEHPDVPGGGGGGGRIAIWSIRNKFTGTLTTPTGGTTARGANGAAGTLVLGQLPFPGTMISVY